MNSGVLCLALLLPPAQDPVTQGNRAFSEARYAEAAGLYEKALEKKKDPLIYGNLGHARFRLRQWEQAIEAYRESHSAENLRWIGQCHLELGRLEEAEHALLDYLSRFPADREVRQLRARVCSRRGRHEQAARIYRALLREASQDGTLCRLLANEELAAGREVEAIDALEIAWRLGERKPDLARLLGDLYLNREMHLEAAAYYHKFLVGSDRVSAEDYFRIGYAYYAGKEHVSAGKFFRQAVKQDVTYAKGFLYLGNVSAQSGALKEAEKQFELALEKDPTLGAAHVALGDLYFQERRFLDAASSLSKAITQGVRSLPVHYNRVVALAKAGRKPGAIAALKQGLHDHPSSSRLLGLLKVLERQ